MKRLITIAFIFLSLLGYSQTGEIKPIGAKMLQSPNNPTFHFNVPDTTVWISMGTYGYMKLAGAKKVRWQLDSLAFHGWQQVKDTLSFYLLEEVDGDITNELNTSVSFNPTTKILSVTDAGGAKSDTINITLGNYVNSYTNKFEVVSKDISINWPTAFASTNYFLNVSAYYSETIGGKAVRMSNAIYDFQKTELGFSMKLDSLIGYVEYFAADTTNLYPLSFDNYVAFSDSLTTFVTPSQLVDSLASLVTVETDPIYSAWDKDYADLINKPDIPDSTINIIPSPDRKYVTDAQLVVIGNTSGTNTGDQDISAMTHTNRAALDLVSGTNTGDQDMSGKMDKSANLSDVANRQAALDTITSAWGATEGQVLTVNATGNAVFAAPAGGSSFSGASVYRTTNFSSIYGTDITFNSERYDTDSYHSTASNTQRIVIPTTGYYRIEYQFSGVLGAGNTYIAVAMYHSTIGALQINALPTVGTWNGSQNAALNGSHTGYFVAGSYIYFNPGGSLSGGWTIYGNSYNGVTITKLQ